MFECGFVAKGLLQKSSSRYPSANLQSGHHTASLRATNGRRKAGTRNERVRYPRGRASRRHTPVEVADDCGDGFNLRFQGCLESHGSCRGSREAFSGVFSFGERLHSRPTSGESVTFADAGSASCRGQKLQRTAETTDRPRDLRKLGRRQAAAVRRWLAGHAGRTFQLTPTSTS